MTAKCGAPPSCYHRYESCDDVMLSRMGTINSWRIYIYINLSQKYGPINRSPQKDADVINKFTILHVTRIRPVWVIVLPVA